MKKVRLLKIYRVILRAKILILTTMMNKLCKHHNSKILHYGMHQFPKERVPIYRIMTLKVSLQCVGCKFKSRTVVVHFFDNIIISIT